ncbi:class I SAM-dependent methyltransferase [Patescibacteria group bacterium]|nr:class I SAM-dependent methyltransferase [Patescibacteria group bacterium]
MYKRKQKTSWGESAEWYSDLLENEKKTYQRDLILPNLLRLMDIKKADMVLDLACGQGFFSREFSNVGANVIGVDVSKELINLAEKIEKNSLIKYKVSSADNLNFIVEDSIDKIVIILAIQNIENVSGVFKECRRVLKSKGKLFIVINHPSFRVPKQSSWEWDAEKNIQYRRIDGYLSESRVKIQMHPGDKPKESTTSFHRPLQFYSKALRKNNFAITKLEEWNSTKKSQPGPRAKAENIARKEIPMFMFLEVRTYLDNNPQTRC